MSFDSKKNWLSYGLGISDLFFLGILALLPRVCFPQISPWLLIIQVLPPVSDGDAFLKHVPEVALSHQYQSLISVFSELLVQALFFLLPH